MGTSGNDSSALIEQARNRFNEVADANGEDSAAAAEAFQEMKDAYQKWKAVN